MKLDRGALIREQPLRGSNNDESPEEGGLDEPSLLKNSILTIWRENFGDVEELSPV
jgi:hypothetical protein